MEGVISGSGSITQNSAAGNLTLAGNNTYTGATTINSATVVITNTDTGTPLGSAATGTTINGGQLRANAQTSTVAEPVILNGGTLGVGGGTNSASDLVRSHHRECGGGFHRP